LVDSSPPAPSDGQRLRRLLPAVCVPRSTVAPLLPDAPHAALDAATTISPPVVTRPRKASERKAVLCLSPREPCGRLSRGRQYGGEVHGHLTACRPNERRNVLRFAAYGRGPANRCRRSGGRALDRALPGNVAREWRLVFRLARGERCLGDDGCAGKHGAELDEVCAMHGCLPRSWATGCGPVGRGSPWPVDGRLRRLY